MHKRILFCFLIVFLLSGIQCGLFEPENGKGSVRIHLVTDTNSVQLAKTQESLSSVRCVLKKGSNTVHDQNHLKENGSFQIDIEDLDPGDDYSINLYGKNSSGDIIGWSSKEGISVAAGEETNVSMSWQGTSTVTDIDGNVYQTVKIGSQWWTAENLKVTHYRNGDAIPNVTSYSEWSHLTTGAYCNYNNDENNATVYGSLYNWYTVNDNRNIAPAGWHVPTDAEWKELEMCLGMSQAEANASGWRGTDEGGKMKEAGTAHWQSPNTGATNESGFSALPGGDRLGIGGPFYNMGYSAYFWSSSEDLGSFVLSRRLGYSGSEVERFSILMRRGCSVRCVRDN